MIAWLKENSGKLSFGTGGIGSPPHISGISFENNTGVKFQFVPYRGAGPAMLDLVAGHIDLMFDQASNSLPHIRGGAIKVYAVTAKARLAGAPEIPTVDEAGMPGFYASVWHGIWVPKGTPKDVIDKLNAAIVEALADPAVKEKLGALGQEILAARSADAAGARRISQGRDREMVAGHQGRGRQGGVTGPAALPQ